MALIAYLMEERVHRSLLGPDETYGWLLQDGLLTIRKCPFKCELDRDLYETSIEQLLGKFVDPKELKLREIAALLFNFGHTNETVTNQETMYLEHLLDSHDDMTVQKSDIIMHGARLLSDPDVVADKNYSPRLLLAKWLKKAGIDG